MASGTALCSDHVNYLILRYLQEAGHESAATAFHREWHRLPEFKDPEQYPFARTVKRGELVSVIQDGLQYDELVVKVKKNERRFLFTQVVSREGDNGVRDVGGSAGKRKERIGGAGSARVQEDFPTPAPKRVRRSDGSDGLGGPVLNGDAMDVDAESGSPDGDVDDGEPASPGEEEVEIVEVPERYDSMDAAVQAAPEAGPPTKTMYWKIDKPDSIVTHSAFSPAPKSEGEKTHTLLTIGSSLCRFHQVPDEVDDSKKILSIDDPTLPPNAEVTAAAWSPDGTTAACAIDSWRELPGGKSESRQTLLTHSHRTGTASHYIYPPLLEAGAVVLALRYRAKLLVIRTNGKRGLVLVYETDSDRADPLAWRILEHMVIDAVWLNDDEFVLCGSEGLLECHRVLTTTSIPSSRTPETIASHGLEKQDWLQPLDGTWDKVRYDEAAQIVALASSNDKKLAMCSYKPSVGESSWTSVDLRGNLTALAFQVERAGGEHSPLLAAAFEDGSCTLHTYHTEPTPSIDTLITIHVSTGPALALAWSPNGAHLAVSSTETINIWETGALVRRNSSTQRLEQKPGAQTRAFVTWQADPIATLPGLDSGRRNGEEREVSEPSLSWTSDGEGLGFAVEKQIAVIRFEKPLMKSGIHADESATVNGVES